MACEPIIEKRWCDVASGLQLLLQPGKLFVIINSHWNMIGLCHPDEPMGFKDSENTTQELVCEYRLFYGIYHHAYLSQWWDMPFI